MYEKEIRDRLCEMHDRGMSYDEISQKTNISKTTVGHVITGGRSIKNPTISLLLKVFPRCRIDLDGNSYISSADHGGVSVQDISVSGNGNNFFSAENSRITKITDAVMTSDLPAESKVKVYQIIKDCE